MVKKKLLITNVEFLHVNVAIYYDINSIYITYFDST